MRLLRAPVAGTVVLGFGIVEPTAAFADSTAVAVRETEPVELGALEVHDLGGHRIQRLTGDTPNNVDLRGNVDGTAADERSETRFSMIDPDTRRPSTAEALDSTITEFSFYTYCSRRSGQTYAYVAAESGDVEQWAISFAGGRVTGTRVRGWNVGGEVEARVADATGHDGVSDEEHGIWKYLAGPDEPTIVRVLVDQTGVDGHLTAVVGVWR